MQASAGAAPGVRTQGRKGDDGSHTASPPPLQRDKCRASCLRRACDVLTPEDGQRGRPPPPPPSPPPTQERGEDSEETARGHGGRAEDRQTRQGERRAAGGGDEKKQKTKNKTNQRAMGKKARRQGPIPRRTGGGWGDMGPQETLVRYPTSGVRGPQRRTPPPHCSQVPHSVLASCLRRACNMRATKGRRQGRPPPPHTPPPPPPPRGWGMTVAERGPPPRGQSGRVERQRREGAGRTTRPCPKGARAVHA